MQERKLRKNRENPMLGRHPGGSAKLSLPKSVIPIKATNGDYWKACPTCGCQYLWDGRQSKEAADAFCSGCGALLIWPSSA